MTKCVFLPLPQLCSCPTSVTGGVFSSAKVDTYDLSGTTVQSLCNTSCPAPPRFLPARVGLFRQPSQAALGLHIPPSLPLLLGCATVFSRKILARLGLLGRKRGR